VKLVKVEGVEEWKVEKILNKKNIRSCEVSSMVKEIYSRA